MGKLTEAICFIFGHRWTVFYQEQCPVEYRRCDRCEWIRHYCDEIDWSKVAREQARLIDPEVGALQMAHRDNALLREAGFNLAEAALRVVRDYDGLHRLSLATSSWFTAIANQGDRKRHARSQSTPDILRSDD